MPYYTEQQIKAADEKSLVAFLNSHGESLKKHGEQYLWEKHQVWIRGNLWYTHYEANGGSAINFVMKYYALDFQGAVAELLSGEISQCVILPVKQKLEKELVVPKANSTMNRVYSYLMNERFISRDVITFFARNKTLYEDEKYHNCIFVGLDEEGVPRHIHRRGTLGSFKQTESGSKAEYSFHYDGKSEWLFVFEAPIDMLAFITLHQKAWTKHSYLALCSLSERAVLHRLKVNQNVQKIVLCLDNDNAGLEASKRIKETLVKSGYSNVRILGAENKDWGEDLKDLNGVEPKKAESPETENIKKLCKAFIVDVKNEKTPPQLFEQKLDLFKRVQEKIPNLKTEQIEKLIGLLLLLAKDECRKCLHEISWNEIYDMLISEYIPYSDNGNTEIRYRQIYADMNSLLKVYQMKNMPNDIEIFTKPILKATMDCIRLLNYLEKERK